MLARIIAALAVLALILFFQMPKPPISPDPAANTPIPFSSPTTEDPQGALEAREDNAAKYDADGDRQIREYDANEAADAFDGSEDDKNKIRKAKLNNSGVLQLYEKLMSPWIQMKEHSRRAVQCNIRTNNWRIALLSEWNRRMLSDQQFMKIKFAMTHDEYLAASADDILMTKWLNADPVDCDSLRDMPFMARYDLVAAGVGPLPGM